MGLLERRDRAVAETMGLSETRDQVSGDRRDDRLEEHTGQPPRRSAGRTYWAAAETFGCVKNGQGKSKNLNPGSGTSK